MHKYNDRMKISLVCYGNILRSQVLEQFLRYYSKDALELYSAGIASPDEFPDEERLFDEIRVELDKRGIPHNLSRNAWDGTTVAEIIDSSFIICADSSVRDTVVKKLENAFDKERIYTFYRFIGEGEKDFEDTYDYENNRQDPVRFGQAFDEIGRIAQKILQVIGISL